MNIAVHVNTLDKISYGTIASGFVATFLLLFVTPANYGRYSNTKLLGINFVQIPGRIAWMVMECPNLVIPAIFFIRGESNALNSDVNRILLSLLLIHYIQRTLIYPNLAPVKPHTILSAGLAFLYCCTNSYIQCSSLMVHYTYDWDWAIKPNFIFGCSLWCLGIFTNIYSDHLLRCLRKPGETGYKVPRGFLFEYVSCANFFGEILEWCGFALACWNLAALSFAVFTICNLVPRGIAHHKYYQEKIEDYPRNRSAVIPFLI